MSCLLFSINRLRQKCFCTRELWKLSTCLVTSTVACTVGAWRKIIHIGEVCKWMPRVILLPNTIIHTKTTQYLLYYHLLLLLLLSLIYDNIILAIMLSPYFDKSVAAYTYENIGIRDLLVATWWCGAPKDRNVSKNWVKESLSSSQLKLCPVSSPYDLFVFVESKANGIPMCRMIIAMRTRARGSQIIWPLLSR